LVVLEPPEQVHEGSMVAEEEQPSPFTAFPSSHCSVPSLLPLLAVI